MNDKLNLEHETPHFGKPLLGVVLSLFDGMSCGQIALNRVFFFIFCAVGVFILFDIQ